MDGEEAELLATSASYIGILLKEVTVEFGVESGVDSFVLDGSEIGICMWNGMTYILSQITKLTDFVRRFGGGTVFPLFSLQTPSVYPWTPSDVYV